MYFDSHSFSQSNAFQVQGSAGDVVFDFENNAYYVELTLSAKSISVQPTLFPPKVSVIQIYF